MHYLIIATLILAIIANLALGALVLQRSYQKMYGWLFAVTVFGVAAWAVGDVIMLLASDVRLLSFGTKLFYIAPLVIPVTILLFSYVFPQDKRIPSVLWLVCGLPFMFWFAFLLADLPFILSHVDSSGTLNIPVANPSGFIWYAAYFSVLFFVTYIILLTKLREQRGPGRTQIAYTFYGVLGASILAMISNLSLPLIGIGRFVWLGPIFTFFFAFMVALAIIRHKLFDIHFYVVRAAAYSLSTIIMSTVYIAPILYIVGVILLDIRFTALTFILTLIIMSTAAIFYDRIRNWFNTYTNRIFFRQTYNPEEFIAELNQSIVSTLDLNVMLTAASTVIGRNVKAEFCLFGLESTSVSDQRFIGYRGKSFKSLDLKKVAALSSSTHSRIIVTDYLPAEHKHLQSLLQANDIALLARLTTAQDGGKAGLGYLILGQKRGGNSYDTQDMRTLDTVINALIIAIQNAFHFEEIQNFNVTLQQQVEQRTRELSRTNAKLVALDETKDDFISMASHQLRTPLTAVKGYLSMILDGDAGKITPQQRKMINQAFLSSQRMVFLIADLLNVSRLKTGKFVIERTEVDLAHLIDQEISQLRETAVGRGLELTYERPKSFPRMMLDETKIRQVVMNFIDNAIHYTPSGGHIAIELVETQSSVELRVSDTGIGVPRAEQHHLFTKFYRAANARRERPDGTGLGLFMAKKVIVAQGGAVIFQSRERKGSTFGFTLPKHKLLAEPSK